MLHYEVDPGVLAPLVPQGTQLDLFHDQQCFVSVVAFRFLETRVLGFAVPFHRDFTEVNLRFYVRRQVDGETRRGVVFIRELVPLATVAWAARATFNEPYRTVAMRETLPPDGGMAGRLCYEWMDHGRWQSVDITTERPGHPMAAGSIEEFLVHREWGFTRQSDGSTLEYRVEHPRWLIWKAVHATLDCDPTSLWGAEFPRLPPAPRLAFAADGSDVTVYAGERIPA